MHLAQWTYRYYLDYLEKNWIDIVRVFFKKKLFTILMT